MVLLTACLLGTAAAHLRSLFVTISLAVAIPVLFAISVVVSGQLSLWPLLLAIGGVNAGLMLPVAMLLLLGHRRQHVLSTKISG